MDLGFVTEALPYLPARDGFRLYGANLIRCLSRRHRIHLVSLLREGDADHMGWARQHCASVTGIAVDERRTLLTPLSMASAHVWGRPLRYRRALAAALRSAAPGWELLHVEGGYAAGLVSLDLPLPRLLSVHDSGSLRCGEMARCARSLRERAYYRVLAYHESRYERLVYPRFARCIVVSDRDAQAVRQTVPTLQVEVIPNGVDCAYYRPANQASRGDRLVFHGNMQYSPNVAAVRELTEEIWPAIRRRRPVATLHIVGSGPPASVRALDGRDGISVLADPPDVRPALAASGLYVCPLRHGSGLKNKVLEAMAMGLPVVCYAEAAVGLDCRSGTHLLVAESPAALVECVLDLLARPERATAVGQAARRFVEQGYSWEQRAQALDSLYVRVADEHRRRARSA